MIWQGFGLEELENIPFWRYETIVEKTLQLFESIKEAKQNMSSSNKESKNSLFNINKNKHPDTWTMG